MMLLATSGCVRDFGEGGTGERVVARERLRTIQPLALEPATPPLDPLAATQPSTRPATRPAARVEPLELGISDVRRAALANNLELRVELIGPAIAQQSLSAERAAFESLFTLDASYGTFDSPTASSLAGSQVEQWNVNPGLVIPLQTGGSVRFSLPNSRLETNNQFSTLNPSYETDASVSILQPLLRGAGTDANAQRIRVAFYQAQQAEARTKLNVIRILADADRFYWRLVAARQAVEVRRRELELAETQLERARRQVAAGTQPEVEITRAESGVADRVEAIITAEVTLRQRQRDLKRVLNLPDVPIDSPAEIIPLTPAMPIEYAFDVDRLADAAVRQRMELLEVELQIAAETANVLAARNATLPVVSLEYTYNLNGLGGEWPDAVELLGERDYQDHRFGLQVQVPIGNQAARSRLRAALLSRLQSLADLDSREQQVRLEVHNAADRLRSNWQRIAAARQRVTLAQRVVEAETRQFEQGSRTSTEVLEAQTNLADAATSLIAALADYHVAQVDLAYATGTLLGASDVTWTPATSIPADADRALDERVRLGHSLPR
jgi:outer membrane protein TolC